MIRFNSGGSAPPAAQLKTSAMITILAALVACYLAIAVYYAVFEAVSTGGAQLWIFAFAALMVLGVSAQINWRFGLVLVLALSFLAQLSWVMQIGASLIDEPASFWLDARRLAASLDQGGGAEALGHLHESPYPSALIVYGLAAFLFNDNLATVQALTAAVWTAQTLLVWKVASEVSETKSRAFACALVFGLSPTLIVFGGLPSVEALFGLFVLAAFYVMLSHRNRGLGLSAFYSGALVALAFLARPSGVGYLVGLIAVLAVGFAYAGNWVQRGRMAAAVGACLLGFGVGVAPQIALNYAMEGRLSIAPGAAIGSELLLGTERGRSPGEALSAHQAEIDALADTLDARDAAAAYRRAEDLVARDVALGRIAEAPLGFAGFALSEKMNRIWASEKQMLRLTIESPEAELSPVISGPIGAAAPSIVGGWYLALLVAAAAGALRLAVRGGAVRDPTRWVLVFMAFVSLVGAAALGDAQERRHLAFTPLLALLAPLPFARLPNIVGRPERAGVLATAIAGGARAIARARKRSEEDDEQTAPSPAVAAAGVAAPAPVEAEAASASSTAPPEGVSDWSAEQKLAHVLRKMSKPPRPPEEDGDQQKNDGPTAENA